MRGNWSVILSLSNFSLTEREARWAHAVDRHISMARPVRMLSSAASTIRRLLTASRI